ncbi:hypothetical protein HBI12_031790 [Parastagonospora nodorum]|nr:hypothetical protein HBI12_031790 [Parastagonospora nodorum]
MGIEIARSMRTKLGLQTWTIIPFSDKSVKKNFAEVSSRDLVAHRSLSPGNCSLLPGNCQACERLQAAGAI